MEEIKVLINKAKLEKRIEELAKQIEKDYKGKDIVFIGVLKGCTMFFIDLAKKISNDVAFEFVEISSYEGIESTGRISLNKALTESIKGKDVIIIEDIIDTGRTLQYLVELLKSKEPRSLKIATLLSKPSRRVIDLNVDYIGFQIDDLFVVGYGLDYNQKYRNLPYIGYIES